MSTTSFATSSADGAALDAAVERHAGFVGSLTALVARTQAAAREPARTSTAQPELVSWARHELLPHLAAEERWLYPAAHELAEGRQLARALVLHHQAVEQLVELVAEASNTVQVAALATALHTLFEVHVRTEDELLLPMLAAAPGVSLDDLTATITAATVLDTAPETDAAAARDPDATDDHACGCGEHDQEIPELDARIVPHAIRHATIFGALDAVAPGRAMVLIAPHDPLPLLAQNERRSPDEFAVEYLERGPEAWRLRFQRRPR